MSNKTILYGGCLVALYFLYRKWGLWGVIGGIVSGYVLLYGVFYRGD